LEARSWKQKVGIFAALMFSSAVCLALYVVRVVYTGELTHFFLNWNLFLAWIPLLCAVAAYGMQALRSKLRYAAALPCAAVWLLFFPNAPYLLTDLLHLSAGEGAPAWFDLVMILSFAWTGLLLGFVSLYLMQDLVSQALGRLALRLGHAWVGQFWHLPGAVPALEQLGPVFQPVEPAGRYMGSPAPPVSASPDLCLFAPLFGLFPLGLSHPVQLRALAG